LLEQPITDAEVVIGRVPKEALNRAGQEFCHNFEPLTRKFPFNPYSNEDLSIESLNYVLAPKTGALWQFYDKSLAPFLARRGLRYEASTDGSVRISPDFLNFFNRAASSSDALYPQGSAPPKFSFLLRELPSTVEGLVLKIGGDTLSGAGQQKTFLWTGNNEDVQVTARGGDILYSQGGPWAAFHFIADAHSPILGPIANLVWTQQSNGRTVILPSGKQKFYSYQLQVTSSWNPFRQSDLSIRCVSQVAR
jgi:type VI protein secretion system component VasK